MISMMPEEKILDKDEAEILRVAKKVSEAAEEPYISRKETICNLINMAKHDERKAIKFYKELRDKVPSENKSLAETIEEIMKDEEDHYQKVIEILNQCIEPTHRRPIGGHIYFE